MAGVTLRVKAGMVELPHRVGTVEMSPDGTFQENKAEGLLKTYPNLYEKAVGNADMSKYSFKKTFQVNEVQKVLDQLTEEGRLDVYEYAKKLLAEEKKPAKPAKPEKKELSKDK